MTGSEMATAEREVQLPHPAVQAGTHEPPTQPPERRSSGCQKHFVVDVVYVARPIVVDVILQAKPTIPGVTYVRFKFDLKVIIVKCRVISPWR